MQRYEYTYLLDSKLGTFPGAWKAPALLHYVCYLLPLCLHPQARFRLLPPHAAHTLDWMWSLELCVRTRTRVCAFFP